MDLRDYLRVLRRGWALILAFVLVGIALGVGLTLATTKVYQASTQVFVASTSSDTTADAAQGNTFTQARVQSYVSIATSPGVTRAVIKALGLHLSDQQLAAKISADAPLNTVLINLHVTDHDPAQAARLANQVADRFNYYVERTDNNQASGKPLVELTTIHPAAVPSAPVTPNKVLNLGLGLILGLLVGIGVAVLREVLDNTMKGPEDFEELGLPVLAYVPFDKRTSSTPIAFRSDLHGARSEAFRQLRTNLQFVDVDHPPRIIAVTSAISGEGKTTSAINLAAALAEAGSRVCLIEADLRRPSIAKALGLVGDVGFTTVVIGKAPVETVLQNAGRNLSVLTSGPIPPNPSELLLSRHSKQVIAEIATKVDYTIIDTPPLLPVTDGAEIATIADATLLVHRAAKTSRDQAVRSIAALDKVGRRPVGVILNMITRGMSKYDYQYGYYYSTYRPESANGGKRLSATNGNRRAGAASNVAASDVAASDEVASDVAPSGVAPSGVAPSDVAASDVAASDGKERARVRHQQ